MTQGPKSKARRPRTRRWSLRRRLFVAGLIVLAVVAATGAYFYLSFARTIEDRLHGERERTLPRVFARPVEIRRGQSLSQIDLIARLNDLGYAQRTKPEQGGEFSALRDSITVVPRTGPFADRAVVITFAGPPAGRTGSSSLGVRGIELRGDGSRDSVLLDPPLLTALMPSGVRQKRRRVPLASIPARMRQAVLAIEDQSFYSHPGVNPFRVVAAGVTNVFGSRTVGNSTLTQQLARMFFQADEFNAELQSGSRSYGRYMQGAVMSMMLERRASKDEILELYLNDVYLGQRGSFAIHGVAEASRIFFGKDVANLTVAEAALIAGVIQSPASRSPFSNPKRSVERRNIVVRAMEREGYVTTTQADAAVREPLQVVARSVDNEAPYFVDMVSQQLTQLLPGITEQPGVVDVYTTLDLNLQRSALDAVRRGLSRVDDLLKRRRRPQRAQAALLAIDPRTGEILAMVGGRSYNQSQFNRAVAARRQPGSVFKPFVFLAAFEVAAKEGRTDLTPASLTSDEPGIFDVDGRTWEPRNFDEYDGDITWRRALAMSRNLGTIRVGEQIGFDAIATLWRKVGVGTPPMGVPAITLGVFELTPLEVARAYTLFVNSGSVRSLRAIRHVEAGERTLKPPTGKLTRVARPETTYLVTDMMRSVLDEGTAASARASGFARDAAGKTGTTNDLRDAWFVGFTPELLAVVWVGYDDNQPLSLSGSQAALPIWTDFMKSALAGRPDVRFEAPDGVTFAQIDRETGQLASPGCPHVITEAFLEGSEPTTHCDLHR